MKTTLTTTYTKSGAPLEVVVVVGPDETYRETIPHLLSHKRPRTQISTCIKCAPISRFSREQFTESRSFISITQRPRRSLRP